MISGLSKYHNEIALDYIENIASYKKGCDISSYNDVLKEDFKTYLKSLQGILLVKLNKDSSIKVDDLVQKSINMVNYLPSESILVI